MKRLPRLMFLGVLSLALMGRPAHGMGPVDTAECSQGRQCGPCSKDIFSLKALSGGDGQGGDGQGGDGRWQRCQKTALSALPYIDRLLASPAGRLQESPSRGAMGLLWSEASTKTEGTLHLRPRTGGQLYAQRMATLRAGELYTRILPSTFADEWQTAWQQPTYQQWQHLLAHEAAVMARRQGNQPVTVLVGDSLGLWLPNEQLTRDRLWLNQSISGETTAHVLQRLSYFDQVRPEVIYVMAGVNDLKQRVAPAVIVSNLELIVQRLKVQHPQARIVVLSILPTRFPLISGNRVWQLNRQIAHAVWQRDVDFVDLQPSFIDNQGLLRVDLTTDGLHLSPQGYSLLATFLN